MLPAYAWPIVQFSASVSVRRGSKKSGDWVGRLFGDWQHRHDIGGNGKKTTGSGLVHVWRIQ